MRQIGDLEELTGTSLQQSYILEVSYPPEVKVQGRSVLSQRGTTTLTCVAINGNPDVYAYSWQFNGRYNPSQGFSDVPSTAILQDDGRQLQITDVQYTDAGTYKCTAINTGGYRSGQTELQVYFSPVVVTLNSPVDATIKSSANLSFTVLSVPELTTSHVTVTRDNQPFRGSIKVTKVTNRNDTFLGEVMFISVLQTDYGTYSVSLNNGIGSDTTVVLTLQDVRKQQATSPSTEPLISENDASTLNTSAIAGSTIAALVLGFMAGLLVSYIIVKCRNSERNIPKNKEGGSSIYYNDVNRRAADVNKGQTYEDVLHPKTEEIPAVYAELQQSHTSTNPDYVDVVDRTESSTVMETNEV